MYSFFTCMGFYIMHNHWPVYIHWATIMLAKCLAPGICDLCMKVLYNRYHCPLHTLQRKLLTMMNADYNTNLLDDPVPHLINQTCTNCNNSYCIILNHFAVSTYHLFKLNICRWSPRWLNVIISASLMYQLVWQIVQLMVITVWLYLLGEVRLWLVVGQVPHC